jgi:hypothetical protein
MMRGREEAVLGGADRDDIQVPTMDEVNEQHLAAAMGALTLHVSGENIWVASGQNLTRHEWDTGKAGQIIDVGESGPSQRDGDYLVLEGGEDGSEVRRINLVTGEVKAGKIPGLIQASNSAPVFVARGRPGAGKGRAAAEFDPAKLARDFQNLPLPNRLALPATLAAAANQERLKAELNGVDPAAAGQPNTGAIPSGGGDQLRVIPTSNGFVQLSSHLTERRTVTRKVMKEAPGKSALDGPVGQAATVAIANEILNDIARERMGDSMEEDESHYQVTLRRAGAADWTGEVTGNPGFIPLATVDLVTGPKSVVVLDKTNKKLWETKLTHELTGGDFFEHDSKWGAGPAVEQEDSLYLFDGGVLSAFDLRTGNARWRLPSVGIEGLFFDEKGMLYVNTTTAGPESVRLSRQIDVSQKTHNVVLKLDPKTGKTLWRAENDGMVRYLSGKYLYTVESSAGETPSQLGMNFGAAMRPHIRIKRLSLSSGRVMWEHHQERAPLDVQFEKNEIRILFRKELQVLRFLTL